MDSPTHYTLHGPRVPRKEPFAREAPYVCRKPRGVARHMTFLHSALRPRRKCGARPVLMETGSVWRWKDRTLADLEILVFRLLLAWYMLIQVSSRLLSPFCDRAAGHVETCPLWPLQPSVAPGCRLDWVRVFGPPMTKFQLFGFTMLFAFPRHRRA